MKNTPSAEGDVGLHESQSSIATSGASSGQRAVSQHLLAISVGQKVKEIASTVKVRTNALDEVTNLLVADLRAREEQLPPGDSEELAHFISGALEEVREEVLELWGPEIEFDVVERGMHDQFENLKIYLALELRARSEDPGDVRAIRAARKGVRAQLWASVYSPFAINLADSFVERIARRKCELVREESREIELVRDVGRDRPSPSPPVYQQAEGDQSAVEPVRVAGGSEPKVGDRFTDKEATGVRGGRNDEPSGISRRDTPVVMTEGSEAKITDDGQGLLKEGEREKIRKAAEAGRAPPGGPYQVTGTTPLSLFKTHVSVISSSRGWSKVHEYYYLAHHIEARLWIDIVTANRMLLKNPLRRDSYSEAVDDIWRALERRAGKNRESEILQSEGLTIQQKKGESVSDFLHRVNDFRLRCQCAGIVRKDSYWITLCRVGLTNELIKRLSCLSAVRTWEEWSENVEQMAGDDAAGGRVAEVLGVSASNTGGTLNSGTGDDATRGRGDGKGPAEFRGKCFFCHQGGHRASQCPNRNLAGKCFHCKKPGHRRAQCPLLQSGSAAADAQDGEVSGDGGTSGQGSKDQQAETAQKTGKESAAGVRVTTNSFAVECCESGAGLRSVAVGRNDEPPVLSLRWADEEMTMLLDSGSAASLIDRETADRMIKKGVALAIAGQSPVSIRYADARVEPSCGELIANVWIGDKPAYLPFLIVGKLGRPLIGRRGLGLLGVSLDFPQDAPSERVALREMFEGRVCDAMTAEVALATGVIDCYCTNDELFLTDDTYLKAVKSGLSRPSPVSDGSGERDVLDRRVDEVLAFASDELRAKGIDYRGRERELLSDLFSRVSALGDITISDGYELSLRKEGKGSEGPGYSFVVKWKTHTSSSEKASQVPRGWCSDSLIQKLDEKGRSEFDQHCSVYTEKGWWKKVVKDDAELSEIRRSHPVGTIFPVKQSLMKSTRIRPVAESAMRICGRLILLHRWSLRYSLLYWQRAGC